ncbi:MAG: XylR family transcriptional regulator [Phycisphaeraceae bacterium]|nr:XylR family transcriptional regulator [Phycisphaeraceae bacterium]
MPAGHAELAGVARYAALHGPWTIQTHPRGGFMGLPPDRPFDGQGMVVHANQARLPSYHEASYPVVNLGAIVAETGLPSVLPDNRGIGRLAAEHLLERGLERLGFCGFVGHGYSDQRLAGAREFADARGVAMRVYPQEELGHPQKGSADYYDLERSNLMAWLEGLDKPIGVIGANDMRARHLLAACQWAGIAVPEQVAIIGVDGDEVLCETAVPALSSIGIDFERLGYEAAALLDRLMRGERAPQRPILLPPMGVIERQSTDILAIADPDLAHAVRLIREHASDDDLTIKRVLAEVPVSRRSLERRFREVLGRTPQAEITRIRVEQARRLLARSDLPMPQVAARSGFRSAARLAVVFHRETGQTPTAYRRHHRQSGQRQEACRAIGRPPGPARSG